MMKSGSDSILFRMKIICGCISYNVSFFLTERITKQQVSLFISEGLSLLGAVHKNVLGIVAVNFDAPQQPLLVYPCTSKGNLKRF